jgi:hypothetical protein
MKAARFVSIAAPERQRLAAPAKTLALGLAMAMALLAVFPAQSLEHRLATTVEVDPVSLAYLRAWLRAKPDDYYLRLVLARQEMHEGDLDKVESTLSPLLHAVDVESRERSDAEVLMLSVREQQLWRTAQASPAYADARHAYLLQLRQISSYAWPRTTLGKFADTAFALGDNALGRELYLRLIKDSPTSSFDKLDRVVQVDLADGHYREAATLCFWALPYTQGLDQRRQYFLNGLRILTSGNLLRDAIAASETRIGALADDPQTLMYVVHLALAGQRPDIAARFTSRLLKQHVEFGEGVG